MSRTMPKSPFANFTPIQPIVEECVYLILLPDGDKISVRIKVVQDELQKYYLSALLKTKKPIPIPRTISLPNHKLSGCHRHFKSSSIFLPFPQLHACVPQTNKIRCRFYPVKRVRFFCKATRRLMTKEFLELI